MIDLEVVWAAGLFDGEGCIYLKTTKSGRKRPIISITQLDDQVLKRFAAAMTVGKVYGPSLHRGKKVRYSYRCERKLWVPIVIDKLWPHLSPPKKSQIARIMKEANI